MRRPSECRPRDTRTATNVREVCADYDELTELPNQQAFHDHVARAIGSTRNRSRHRFAVVLVDLDGIQAVTDRFGRTIAQKLLAVTARRLELCVGAQDIVARVGAGTFAILLPEIGAVSAAEEAAARVVTLMSLPAIIDEREICTTIGVGIAVGNATHRRPHEVLHDASAAGRNARGAGHAGTLDAAPRHGHGTPFVAHGNPRPRLEFDAGDDASGKTFEGEREAGRREAVGVF
jgi:diguanylate cyclase (GGDEF)-like protein